jgi:hypothetical protein
VRKIVCTHVFIHEFPKGENVFQIPFDLLNPEDFKDKKLILHSLFYSSIMVKWFYNAPELLKRSYWVTWGPDIFDVPRDEKTDFVRRNVYSVCTNSSSATVDQIKQEYGDKHVINRSLLIDPMRENLYNVADLRKRQMKNDAVVVQVNVAALEGTLEMLDVLAKYKDEKIRVRTVVSNGDTQLCEAIVQKGKSIFGDKFLYLDEILPAKNYMEYLNQNDILILYNDTHRGGGNAVMSLMLGKKVFMEQKTMLWYQENSIKVFASNKIKDMNFRDFCEISKEAVENNISNTEAIYHEEKTIKDFAEVFDDIIRGDI